MIPLTSGTAGAINKAIVRIASSARQPTARGRFRFPLHFLRRSQAHGFAGVFRLRTCSIGEPASFKPPLAASVPPPAHACTLNWRLSHRAASRCRKTSWRADRKQANAKVHRSAGSAEPAARKTRQIRHPLKHAVRRRANPRPISKPWPGFTRPRPYRNWHGCLSRRNPKRRAFRPSIGSWIAPMAGRTA